MSRSSSISELDALKQFGNLPHVSLTQGFYGASGRAFLEVARLGFDQRALQARHDTTTRNGSLLKRLGRLSILVVI